jgi:hypothetical protein
MLLFLIACLLAPAALSLAMAGARTVKAFVFGQLQALQAGLARLEQAEKLYPQTIVSPKFLLPF